MNGPWLPVEPLRDADYAALRRRAIFECDKWDPQVGDENVIARHPLVIRRDAWREVADLAERLAREVLAAEIELARRPDLFARLGLPRRVRRALSHGSTEPAAVGVARLVRFDFHFTEEGWRISEANTDVPGGLNEASGFAALMAPHYPWAAVVGDPASAYVDALAQSCPPGASIALVHATAYSDDRQMMRFVARRAEAAGLRPEFASPAHLRWPDGIAHLETAWRRAPMDAILRFFPGDWLTELPARCQWRSFFAGSRTPISNPATAVLTQTKRFPLVWDDLETRLPTWRALLPETRDPRDVLWRADAGWIVKPALGRVGEGVGIAGCVGAREWRDIRRGARWWPGSWIAQRRFRSVPMDVGGTPMHVCLGVYTIDGHVAGAYGRLAPRPLIDDRAADAAVFAA